MWPTNLERDPRVTVIVYEGREPVRLRRDPWHARRRTDDGADAHIDALAKKYLGQDEYPFRQPGEQRVKFADRSRSSVRYVKQ